MGTRTKILIAYFIGMLVAVLAMIFPIIRLPSKEETDENYELMLDMQTKMASLEPMLKEYEQKIVALTKEIEELEKVMDSISHNEDSEKQPSSIQTNFVDLQDVQTNMFCAMDYRKITNTASDQYKIQQRCTNNEYGIRTYGKYLTAALGSYFTRRLGDTYHVTLENGYEFDIMLGDFKDDGSYPVYGHPCTNYDGEYCINVIEFIIDDQAVPSEVMNAGTFSVLDEFGGLNGPGGNIKSMEYTGHVNVFG